MKRCVSCRCTVDENYANKVLKEATDRTCDHCDLLHAGASLGCERPDSCWQRRAILKN